MNVANVRPRLGRRTLLRLWALALASTCAELALPSPARAAPSAQTAPPASGASVLVEADSVRWRAEYDRRAGRFAVTSIAGFDTTWVPADAVPEGGLWIDEVAAGEQPPVTIDGSGGLELVNRSSKSITLLHTASGLKLALEYAAGPGSAITHRLTLTNTRRRDPIRIGSAATLGLPLWAGDHTEVLAGDDTPRAWELVRDELPASYGNHELRNATDGVYPVVRLATADGGGMIVAVNSATAWRVDVQLDGVRRFLRAGEYQSDLELAPGEQARLPEVVTIFYNGGPEGAVAELRRYLEGISLAQPRGWDDRTPPVIFNTWYGYGTHLLDDGSDDSELRRAARNAAESGVEVFVIDAGWYAGNPIPDGVGARGQGVSTAGRSQGYPEDLGDAEDAAPPTVALHTADDFYPGLGTWVENGEKWQAPPGSGDRRSRGLRNFSDYVRALDVLRPDGSIVGKMRFGLWVEPERFDAGYRGPNRTPPKWALRGAPILDFTRQEVVEGITNRLQRAIDAYAVQYLKVDANQDLIFDPARRRTGHFWTRWSFGFEQLLTNLRTANPDLYIEHCASGLKRYWLGLSRLAHSNWLDDDIGVDAVGGLLDATDVLMLPRQKTVLMVEDLTTISDIPALVWTYAGDDHRNGGTIGFSSRIDQWSGDQQRPASEAVEEWKRDVRGFS